MKTTIHAFGNKAFFFLGLFLLLFPGINRAQDTTHLPDGNVLYDKSYHQVLTAGSGKHVIVREPELPRIRKGDVVIRHSGYTVCYNAEHKQASWVAYELTADETKALFERADQFVKDPELPQCPVSNADYRKSGYDKGHLAPAADMAWSAKTMAESFYFSNISPQVPAFNRGIWKRLEGQTRQWAIDEEAICIATGGILTSGLSTVGQSNISIPVYFYKVILDYTPPVYKGIAFIMPNKGSSMPIQHYVVTIDSVERLTGIDFFSNIPPYIQRVVESSSDTLQWSWSTGKIPEGVKEED